MFSAHHAKVRNIYGVLRRKGQCFDQIKFKVKGSEPLLAAIYAKYLAVLINCSAVDVMIRPLEEIGRIEADPKGIEVATCLPIRVEWCIGDGDLSIDQQSGEINLIQIPNEEVTDPINIDDAEVKWSCDSGSILSAVWYPTVGDAVLNSCGGKFAGAGSSADIHLIMWGTVKMEKLIEIQLNNCHLTSLFFNFNGSKVVCTDNLRVTRVVHMRSSSSTSQEAMPLYSCGNAIVQLPNQCVTIPNDVQASMRSFQVIPMNVARQFSAVLPPAHLFAVPDRFDGKRPLANGAFGVVRQINDPRNNVKMAMRKTASLFSLTLPHSATNTGLAARSILYDSLHLTVGKTL